MECKEATVDAYGEADGCINRNILECKGLQLVSSVLAISCINRNILECKVCPWLTYSTGWAVLIETYWNVKWETHVIRYN